MEPAEASGAQYLVVGHHLPYYVMPSAQSLHTCITDVDVEMMGVMRRII